MLLLFDISIGTVWSFYRNVTEIFGVSRPKNIRIRIDELIELISVAINWT